MHITFLQLAKTARIIVHASAAVHCLKNGFAISHVKIEKRIRAADPQHNHDSKIPHSTGSITCCRLMLLCAAVCTFAAWDAVGTRPQGTSVFQLLPRNNTPDAIGGDETCKHAKTSVFLLPKESMFGKHTGCIGSGSVAQVHLHRSGRRLRIATHRHAPLHLPTHRAAWVKEAQATARGMRGLPCGAAVAPASSASNAGGL